MRLSDTELAARLLEQREWLADLARNLVGEGEAEDLVQETWLAALRQSAARGDLRAWLSGVARNLARGLRRGHRHRSERERRSARPEALPPTAELVEQLDTEQRLTREIIALREPYRTTLLLRFHEGRSAEEIATSQGIPAGTVRWRTKQGLDELRARDQPLAVTLDEGGWTALSGRVGACELALERENTFPHLERLELHPGDQEQQLPRGEVLSGRLVVDGRTGSWATCAWKKGAW